MSTLRDPAEFPRLQGVLPAATPASPAIPPQAAPPVSSPVSASRATPPDRITPRFELEPQPADRLLPGAAPVQSVMTGEAPGGFAPFAVLRGGGSFALAASGVGVLAVGVPFLAALDFIAAEFARSALLGIAALGVCGAGFGAIGLGVARELRGLFRLRSIDGLRAGLANPETRREAAREWLGSLPDGALLLPAVNAVNDPDAITALLRAGPGAALRERAQGLGRAAAAQVFAITAAVPAPALDGLVVAWRGARLVREVAELHGMRPGLIGTLSLLRRTASASVQVAATGWAADAAVRAVLSNPLVGHVAGDLAGAGVAARRMVVLARAAATACSPLPPD